VDSSFKSSFSADVFATLPLAVARPLRIEFPGAYYHVMNRGLERRRTFVTSDDHRTFLELLADVVQRWQVKVFAYCCMPNHYHILLQTPLGNLSRVMRHIDGVYTQRFNRARQRDGPLFRGRYKSILVDAEAYLLQVVRYIHLNPVKPRHADDPSAYVWSSHRLYRARVAPTWLARGIVLAHFANAQAFEVFVAEGNERSLEAFYQRKRWTPFLGDRAFTLWALAKAKLSTEHARAQKTPQYPSLAAVADRISERMGVEPGRLFLSQRGVRNIPRDLAIYVAGRVAGFAYSEICDYFGFNRKSAVSQAATRVARLLAQTPKLQKVIA